jgi:hypothetical protein
MITHNVQMEATEQERQMLGVIRDHGVGAASDFRLLVQRQDGAWDVTLSIAPHDELDTSRGTGTNVQRRLGQLGTAMGLSVRLATLFAAH